MLSIDQTATRLRKRIPVQPVAVFMYWWNCSIFYDLTVWLSGLRRLTFTREALGSNLPGFTFENISSTMPISTPDALTHAQMRPTRLRKRITRLRKRRSGGWDTLRSVTSITQPLDLSVATQNPTQVRGCGISWKMRLKWFLIRM